MFRNYAKWAAKKANYKPVAKRFGSDVSGAGAKAIVFSYIVIGPFSIIGVLGCLLLPFTSNQRFCAIVGLALLPFLISFGFINRFSKQR